MCGAARARRPPRFSPRRGGAAARARHCARRASPPARDARCDRRRGGLAVQRMAKRFIVGRGPGDAVPALARLWRAGAAASVDLLGEATVTAAEADRYARRCDEALRTLAAAAQHWPRRPVLERDSAGPLPRVNLSREGERAHRRACAPTRPSSGIADAADRLRGPAAHGADVGAHLHVDMESMDSRELVTELVLQLLAEPEFARRPVGRDRPAGLPARRRRAARPHPRRPRRAARR